jgi:ABC-type phosphate transport system substrate-binding protein
MIRMKKVCLLSLILCAGAFAQNDTAVRWHAIAGVITADGVDNPVGQIHSGAGPWTARGGNARINLGTGEGAFEVEGLVLNGGNASGTPGGVHSVIGTVVCNAGSVSGPVETAIDTQAVDLSATGDAELSFKINVPANCNNPLFLVRVPGAGRWIATGTRRTTRSDN